MGRLLLTAIVWILVFFFMLLAGARAEQSVGLVRKRPLNGAHKATSSTYLSKMRASA